MDCLVEAEVVLTDGRVVWVSEEGVRGEDGELIDEGEDAWGEGEVLEDEDEEKGEDKADAQDGENGEGENKGKEKDKGEEKERTPTPEADAEKPKRGLWWAMRGAGSAFGIVVRYKAKAFPVPVVFAGNLI